MPFTRRTFIRLGLPALGAASFASSSSTARAEQGGKPVLRFGVIADPQYADIPPKGTRHYAASLGKLDAAIAELNQHDDLAFTLTLGDLIDRNFASFDPVLACYSRLKSPHRIILGNHDFDMPDADKPRVLEKLRLTTAHQSFPQGKWRIITIDGTSVSTYRYPETDPRTAEARKILSEMEARGLPNAQNWNGAVSPAQLVWLEEELQAAKAAGQRVILAGHYPLQPTGDAHLLWNADAVVEIINRHPHVAAYLNGHDHRGGYTSAGKCHYINFKGMVETATDNAFAIVTCYEDSISVEGFGPEPDREGLR